MKTLFKNKKDIKARKEVVAKKSRKLGWFKTLMIIFGSAAIIGGSVSAIVLTLKHKQAQQSNKAEIIPPVTKTDDVADNKKADVVKYSVNELVLDLQKNNQRTNNNSKLLSIVAQTFDNNDDALVSLQNYINSDANKKAKLLAISSKISSNVFAALMKDLKF